MSCLMLETVKGLIAQRALVWSGQILSVVSMLTSNHGWHHTDGSHFCFFLLALELVQFPSGGLLLDLQVRLWIQQTIKIHCRLSALHVIAAAANVDNLSINGGRFRTSKKLVEWKNFAKNVSRRKSIVVGILFDGRYMLSSSSIGRDRVVVDGVLMGVLGSWDDSNVQYRESLL
jgi:hypothetical protein